MTPETARRCELQATVEVYGAAFREEAASHLHWRDMNTTTAIACRSMQWRLARTSYRTWKAAVRELDEMNKGEDHVR